MAKITKTTDTERQEISRRSVFSLADRPTESNQKPQDIKNAIAMPVFGTSHSVLAELNRVVDALNTILNGDATTDTALVTDETSSLIGAINELKNKISDAGSGIYTALKTADTSSLIDAINELKNKISDVADGEYTALATNETNSLIEAINELKTKITGNVSGYTALTTTANSDRGAINELDAELNAATPNMVGSTLVKRDAIGRIKVAAPYAASGSYAVNVDYLNTRITDLDGATSEADAGTVMKRDANGGTKVVTDGTEEQSAVNVSYAEAQFGNARDKVASATPNATPNTIVKRNGSGIINVGTPINDGSDAQAVNIGYVGKTSLLNTTSKTSFTSAINELVTSISALETTLNQKINGYSRTFYCASWADVKSALEGASTLIGDNGVGVPLSELNTGDLVCCYNDNNTKRPDYWFRKDTSANGTGAETYDNTPLYKANVGYLYQINIDTTEIQGYVTTAEAYAKGTINGSAVSEGQTGYQDNAKYYATQASDSADNSALSAEASEAYAKGTFNGNPVSEGHTGYNDNALHYKNLANNYATSAQGSATSASGSATASSNSALTSEAYAVGTRNGSAVAEGDVAYHNNAKYYAETVAQQTVQNEMQNYVEIDGNYLDTNTAVGRALVAHSIENVSEESGTTQEAPFISQGSGTNNNNDIVDTSPVAKQLEKQGNTLPIIQFVNWANIQTLENQGITFTNNNDGSFTLNGTALSTAVCTLKSGIGSILTAGHKYFVYGQTDDATCYIQGYDDGVGEFCKENYHVFTYPTVGSASTNRIRIRVSEGTSLTNKKIYVPIFDITSWDSDIITDLTTNPSHFSWYYNGSLDYDAGSLQNASGRYLVCTGRQLWDGVWESGNIDTTTGQNVSNPNYGRSKNYILVTPNTKLYILNPSTTQVMYVCAYDKDKNYINYSATSTVGGILDMTNKWSNVRYIRLAQYGWTANQKCTVSLYYTPEQGGEGYSEHYDYVAPKVYDTGTEELLAFDTKLPSGVISRNTKTGTISSDGVTTSGIPSYTNIVYYAVPKPTDMKSYGTYGKCSIANTKGYSFITASNMGGSWDSASAIGKYTTSANNYSIWFGFATGTTIEQAKAILDGMEIQYELATPTTETGTSFTENIEINDYGMMYWLDTNNDLVGIPQGVKLFYPADYVLWLDSAVARTNGDATSLALTSEIDDTALNARGYYKVEDLSDEVSGITGINFEIKKAVKIGSLVALTVRMRNGTGSSISANTTFLTVPASFGIGSTYMVGYCGMSISGSGKIVLYGVNISCETAIASTESVTFTLSYIVP